MRSRQIGLILAVGIVCVTASAAEPVHFTARPTATRAAGGVRILFAVSAPTDVEVAVLGADGKIVRHLAAGVLGANAPAPLVRDSLAQRILWDGRDDAGEPVTGKASVRVALGLRPRLEKMIGHEPAVLGSIRAMAVGPDGKLYLFHCHGSHHSGDGTTNVAVFSREGKYLRTILPYPANLPDEKLAGLRRITRADGRKVPFIYQVETRSIVPGVGDLPNHRAVVTRDGRLAFVGIQEGPRALAQPGEARITVINTDGSVPEDGVLQTLIHPLTDTGASLALSPDEKIIYATGTRAGLHPAGPAPNFTCDHCDHRRSSWKHTVPTNFVYSARWGDPHVRVFIGSGRAYGGRPVTTLANPVAVATDAEGNVYVAELDADRISVFSSDAEPLGQIAVEKPQQVEVHHKSGAVYVLSGDSKLDLVKFSGRENPREIARLNVREKQRWGITPTSRRLLALDQTAEKPILWISTYLTRIVDLGDRFAEPRRLVVGNRDEAGPRSIETVMDLSLDERRGRLYVNNYWRLRLADDTWQRVVLPGFERSGRMWPRSWPGSLTGEVGDDGNYYVHLGSRRARVFRFDGDLKPKPFPKGHLGNEYIAGPARRKCRGMTADRHGNVYVLFKQGAGKQDGDAQHAHALYVFGPDGEPKHEKLIDAEFPSMNGPRVDAAGNIYLAVGLRPGDSLIPPGLVGKVSGDWKCPHSTNGLNGYPLIYGSIIKFGPTGGVIRKGSGGVKANFGPGYPTEVTGAKWIYSGVSVVPNWATPKLKPRTTIICLCESTCFDVDGYGRSFFPDAGRFRCGILDTAGNPIAFFGEYGNTDSAGPGSLVPTADIPFYWPQAIAVADGTVYVGDRLNRRIVVVKLDHVATATCPVP